VSHLEFLVQLYAVYFLPNTGMTMVYDERSTV
jgi:hypothetical protein